MLQVCFFLASSAKLPVSNPKFCKKVTQMTEPANPLNDAFAIAHDHAVGTPEPFTGPQLEMIGAVLSEANEQLGHVKWTAKVGQARLSLYEDGKPTGIDILRLAQSEKTVYLYRFERADSGINLDSFNKMVTRLIDFTEMHAAMSASEPGQAPH